MLKFPQRSICERTTNQGLQYAPCGSLHDRKLSSMHL